ncbi:MAG: sigma-70 family RNA polymerase sigma factor, partial [Bacteroidota bacterium]
MEHNNQLELAMQGDIHAFQSLFVAFQDPLKSYLFRMTANRADAEDLAHDAFIRAFDKINSFSGKSSLKTWVFQIATNLALNFLKKKKRWTPDVSQKAKELVLNAPALAQSIEQVAQQSPFGRYEIKEHIDT